MLSSTATGTDWVGNTPYYIGEFGSITLATPLTIPTDVATNEYDLLDYIITNGDTPVVKTDGFRKSPNVVADKFGGGTFTNFYDTINKKFIFPDIAPLGFSLRVVLKGNYTGGSTDKESVIAFEIPSYLANPAERLGKGSDVLLSALIGDDNPTYGLITRSSTAGFLRESGLKLFFKSTHSVEITSITWLINN